VPLTHLSHSNSAFHPAADRHTWPCDGNLGILQKCFYPAVPRLREKTIETTKSPTNKTLEAAALAWAFRALCVDPEEFLEHCCPGSR